MGLSQGGSGPLEFYPSPCFSEELLTCYDHAREVGGLHFQITLSFVCGYTTYRIDSFVRLVQEHILRLLLLHLTWSIKKNVRLVSSQVRLPSHTVERCNWRASCPEEVQMFTF